MNVTLKCDMCGKEFQKLSCKITRHNFCCRQCLADFSSKKRNPNGYADLKDFTNMANHFHDLAMELNPTRMTPEVKEKIRNARLGSGKGKTYTKLYGKHAHRVAAEMKIGRPLKKGEVVHHIDGNKRNNSPDNLIVFPSQSEHAKHHALLKRLEKGGNAE